MYDRLNESNTSNDGREIQHVQEQQYKRKWSDKSGQDRPRKKRTINELNIETTDADKLEYQIGQDDISAQQNEPNVETAKEESTTKTCADH